MDVADVMEVFLRMYKHCAHSSSHSPGTVATLSVGQNGLARTAGRVFLQPGWERLSDFASLSQGVLLKGLERPSLVKVQHEIELLWQSSVEVVAAPFTLGLSPAT